MSKLLYSYSEYDYIYKNYNNKGAVGVSEDLKRSAASVEARAQKLGLIPHGEFTKEELGYAEEYGKVLGTALLFLMPYRTIPEIEELILCTENA